jgi:hypothetical protein
LSFNDFTEVGLPPNKRFPSLTDIYLNNNALSSWQEICRLGDAFPNLCNLVLINNPLARLEMSATNQANHNDAAEHRESRMDAKACFPVLKSLNISNTRLESWEELESLNHLPELREVRMTGIPFFEVCGMICSSKIAIYR